MKKEQNQNQENNNPTEELNQTEEVNMEEQAEALKGEEKVQEQQEANMEPQLSEIDQLKAELGEAKDKYIRLYSEFENFRRRTAKERIDLTKTASEEVIKDLLSVLDDFERSTKSFETNADVDSLKEGVNLVYSKFFKTLEKKGVKPMDIGPGSDFDAELHEAITQFPTQDEKMKGKVVDVIEKGYYLGDKVIRFAKVVIGA
jgi:molecular chaperone GrpE